MRIFRIRLHSKQDGRVYRLAQADFSGFAKGLQPVLGDPYSETEQLRHNITLLSGAFVEKHEGGTSGLNN